MENVIHYLTLDLTGPDMCPMIEVQRGDSARSLIISLTQGGRPYWIDEGLTAALFGTKPDGNPLFNACTIEKNRIRYDFTPQTANVAGAFDCEIWLVAGDKRELNTPRFIIAVDERMRTDDVIPESEPEYTAITEMVATGTAMIEELRKALAGVEGLDKVLSQALAAANQAEQAMERAGMSAQIAEASAEGAQDAADEAEEAATRAKVDVAAAVAEHDGSDEAHPDIRELLANVKPGPAYVAQDTPPEDTDVLWIDTSEDDSEEEPEEEKLPPVSAANDGAFLRVVDGAYALAQPDQSDWATSDSTDPTYIKNRPFYCDTRTEYVVEMPEQGYGYFHGGGLGDKPLVAGETYNVEFGAPDKYGDMTWQSLQLTAKEFTVTKNYVSAGIYSGETLVYIGNLKAIDSGLTNTGEDFCIYTGRSGGTALRTVAASNAISYQISVGQTVVDFKALDEKFVPESIARVADIPSDDHINSLINLALGVIENGTY